MRGFSTNEEPVSQIPALQQLIRLGYDYLPPKQALLARGGKLSNVILEDILRESLKELNSIDYRGNTYLFSEENIQTAIQKLKNIKYDGLLKTNEKVYDLITLGTSLEQTIEGNTRSHNLKYIDWENPENNQFHVTTEFSVEKNRSLETARPDIVLFVNGIPFVSIECKAAAVELQEAISQSIRNQGEDYISKFFSYVQIVMAVNKNGAKYATTGSNTNYWSTWTELNYKAEEIAESVNGSIPPEQKDKLFSEKYASYRKFFDAQENEGDRATTEQDKAIYSLCRPARLLDITYRFTLFDNGIKKIARYQQFFTVLSILRRIKSKNNEKRKGGIVWHTQGSGKSLTMVMLARALAFEKEINSPRMLLVTDRNNLDKQLSNTFTACGLSHEVASSGRNLIKHLKNKVGIITTLIHKFDKGWGTERFKDESADIFVLVDESHRTNFGGLSASMRAMLPNACYIGFTGTPLLKKEKNNFEKFGGLIEPHYSIRQAVKDKAVVPLLYEGRYVEMEQNKNAIDLWFERHTENLSNEQKADLKRKYARAEMLNKSEQVIYMRAFDIWTHYKNNWQGSGFKAQLVAPSKLSALKYHEFLKELGGITSEVIISPPDDREGHEEVNEGSKSAVSAFWQKMMQQFGSEEEYNKQIINRFKYNDEPEILIVVSKLLTGFDATRNTVLYLCSNLTEHTLLQAIARVNRIHEGKDFGYIIDYASVLGELDKALTMYDLFAGFDEEDIAETITSVMEQIDKLPQAYANLWDIFKEIKNTHDEEAFELLLADESIREDFYECLYLYSKVLSIALSSEKFLMNTEESLLKNYKEDLKRFQKLKTAVKLRYAESIDYRDYEPKIEKLLNTHIQANEVIRLNEPVDIFDEKSFNEIKEGQGIHSDSSTAAKADTIAHATKRVISEKMEEDPAFYEKFSKLIQQAIDAYKAKRMSELEYLKQITDIRNKVVSKKHDDVPDIIKSNDAACALFGVIEPLFEAEGNTRNLVAAETALAIQRILQKHHKVDFWDDTEAQNAVINDIDDYLFDEVKNIKGIDMELEQMDKLIKDTMQIARSRKSV